MRVVKTVIPNYVVIFNNDKEVMIHSDKSLEELKNEIKEYDYVVFGKEVVHSCDVKEIVNA